jgi:hypothetical protein
LAKNQNRSAVAALQQQPLRRVVKYNEISMPFDSFCALHIPGSILMSTASSRGRAISCRRLRCMVLCKFDPDLSLPATSLFPIAEKNNSIRIKDFD